MNKILFIAWKDVRRTFTDRNLLLLMLVTPFMLSIILALALGNINASSFNNIPVVVVNLDEGATTGGGEVNYGQVFVDSLVPGAAAESGTPACEADETDAADGDGLSLFDLTNAVLVDDADAARQLVSGGDYVAAVIIPADYSVTLVSAQAGDDPAAIEVYGDTVRAISAEIIRSVVASINNQIVTGQIAVNATVSSLVADGQIPNVSQDTFACVFSASFYTLGITQENVEGVQTNPLVLFGSAQAAFFALFTASGGATAILEERRDGTLQRMLVSPTSRQDILLGKLLGVFATVLAQLAFLLLSFTVVNSLLERELTFVWGTNFVLIVLLLLATALSAASIGMILAAAARTIEQSSVVGSIVALFMGMFGGAFFPIDVLGPVEFVTRLSIVNWASEGFTELSNGGTDILLNIAVLIALGGVFFVTSLVIFNRRQDI